MKQIVVHKGRTNKLLVAVGFDVSNDVLTSEIRAEKDQESELIATWSVAFVDDGVDGELVLTLDNSVVSAVTKSKGYMDIKRVTGGEPVSLFDDILEVLFKDTVTV